jgi:6-phosphogluconolactonase/glucosamine-6-phosphate isomerase/deaminase
MTSEFLDVPPGELPALDLVLLELAADGSVGAFVPGSPALAEGGGFACPVEVAGEIRYTLTGSAIRRARRVVVVGAGAAEASTVVAALRPPEGELVCLRARETGPTGTASQT